VLAATGRTPNLDRSASSQRRLELDARGVPALDPHAAGGEHSIFIAGDVANYAPLLHEAADEGSIAGDNAARFPKCQPGQRRAPSASSSPIRRSPSWAAASPRSSRMRSPRARCSFEDQGARA
jgi:dihydrolipoamide dehydrogenase